MFKAHISRDVVSGVALLGLSLVYFIGSRGLPSVQDEPGPAFFPTLLSAVLSLLALAIIARGWRESRHTETRIPFALIALTAVYAAAFTRFGFFTSTLLYTFSVTLLLGRRGVWAFVIPSVTTLAIWILLDVGLGAPLP